MKLYYNYDLILLENGRFILHLSIWGGRTWDDIILDPG
jgi:hypothetical protein